MKEYEYNSKSGFLTRVKITTKQVEHFSISKWDKDWIDSMHLKLLEMGLIERRRPNNKHTEFRRIQRGNK